MEYIKNVPVETFMPVLLLRHLMIFSKSTIISPNAIEYGFDTDHMYEKYEMKNVNPEKKMSLMKEIKTKFTDQEELDKPLALNLIIDENAVNSFILDWVLVEKSFSVR